MNFNNLDLNLLRVFDVLMHERNVTRAAERLGKTQSAISHSLGKLRTLFNDELFRRDNGVMNPSPRAIELAADISNALNDIRSTIDRHQSFTPGDTHRNFRIGLTDYRSIGFIPALIRDFSEQAPNARLNIIPATKTEIGPLIHSRQLDCAIIGNFDNDQPNLQRIELAQDRLVCALWSGSTLLDQPLTLERYLAATHLQVSADGRSESLADHALKAQGLSRKVAATIPNYLAIPWVLRRTDLITHCGDSMVLMLDSSSEVILTPAPLPLPDVVISLVLHQQMMSDPATVWLRSLIEQISIQWQNRKAEAWKVSEFVHL
ncbi:LysR family transcriptional regulator [Pseudomonas sp. TE50-2]|uniref:LysR family transcriptional regulator n=1 Tax=Pseudomonas sp. TE50-2 TaxID=3142707 RepID=UPI00346585DE